MLLLTFTLRRLLRHWAINLLVFAGLVLTGTLVAGLPAYAEVIAANSLAQSLENTSIVNRNRWQASSLAFTVMPTKEDPPVPLKSWISGRTIRSSDWPRTGSLTLRASRARRCTGVQG